MRGIKTFLRTGLLFLVGLGISRPIPAPAATGPRFVISDFGAVGDGRTLSTDAVQKTIDACAAAGGGTVVVPAGRFRSGTIRMRSNVELHLQSDAILLGSENPADYPEPPPPRYRSLADDGGARALVYAEGVENIALTGSGTIQGRDEARVAPPLPDPGGLTRNLLFISCKRVRVEGLHLRHAGIWNQHYLDCEDVTVRHVSVCTRGQHNDAIDIDGCRRFVLADSCFDSTDDGITLKSTGPAPCEEITVTRCVVRCLASAIKTGAESVGGFRNITISHCTILPPRPEGIGESGPGVGGAGLVLTVVDGGIMEDVHIDTVTIRGTRAPIAVRLGDRPRRLSGNAAPRGVGRIQRISLSNILAYGEGAWGCLITGMPGQRIRDVSLTNVRLLSAGDDAPGQAGERGAEDADSLRGGSPTTDALLIRHVQSIALDNVTVGAEQAESGIPLRLEDVEDLSIRNSPF